MNNYIKPKFYDTFEVAEPVYLSGSGVSSDCWIIRAEVAQRNTNPWDSFVNFRIQGTHFATHISKSLTIVLTMSRAVTSAVFDYSGFDCKVDGNTITLKRNNHSNAYNSVDNFNSNLRVNCVDSDVIDINNMSWTCEKSVNVQGGI